MSVYNNSAAFTKSVLGQTAIKPTGTLTVAALPLFIISGGLVAVTSLVGRVTTGITVAGTSKLQHVPTTGSTVDLCAATDLGTVPTTAGQILVIDGLKTSTLVVGALGMQRPVILMDSGQITQLTATGANGAISWYLTYVPLDDGASVVAG